MLASLLVLELVRWTPCCRSWIFSFLRLESTFPSYWHSSLLLLGRYSDVTFQWVLLWLPSLQLHPSSLRSVFSLWFICFLSLYHCLRVCYMYFAFISPHWTVRYIRTRTFALFIAVLLALKTVLTYGGCSVNCCRMTELINRVPGIS